MKKGFTLIELLAVITVLAIIATISTMVVINKIQDTKIKSLEISNKSFLNAAIEYLTLNDDLLPNQIGEKIEISLDSLVSANLIKNIKSPVSNNNCSGYLIVQKIEENNYQYVPHLNCINAFNSPGEDLLKAHYTFDSFQEPTENLFQNLNFGTNTSGGLTYTPLGVEDGWIKYSISGVGTSSTYPYTFNITPSLINSNYPTSFSFKYKTNVISKYIDFGSPRMVNIIYKTGMTINDNVVDGYRFAKLENVSPYQTTGGIPITGDSNQAIYFLSRPIEGVVFNPETDFLYFKDIQVERKNYATPFTQDERNGVILDSSANSNNINMELAKSPRWIFDEKRGGVYNFDSPLEVLSANGALSGVYENQKFSWGAFVKLNSNFSQAGRVLMSQTNVLELHINSSRYVTATTRDETGFKSGTSKTKLEVDQWYHLFVTSDGVTTKLYINGNKEAEFITNGFINPSNNIYIGNWSSNQVLNGSIDDVRTYARTLSDIEIKTIYETNKEKI